MARKRLVSPEFFRHADLYEAEVASGFPLRVAFAGLWTVADRRGYFHWKPREIGIQVCPYDPHEFAEVLGALERFGFVQRYEVGGKMYGAIPSFQRWQTFHHAERPSDVPALDDASANAVLTPSQPRAGLGLAPSQPTCSPTVTVTGTVTVNPTGPASAAPPLELVGQEPKVVLKPTGKAAVTAPKAAASYPGFTVELCNQAASRWLKVGSFEYARVRKAFGPMFKTPEADRSPDLPRDRELLPAIDWYLAGVKGSREAAFRSPERCAASLGLIVHEMRDFVGERDPFVKLDRIKSLLGTPAPQRQQN
jgi:hypothetical protein